MWIDRIFVTSLLPSPELDSVDVDMLVINTDFVSRYIWQRENDKPTAKKDECKFHLR